MTNKENYDTVDVMLDNLFDGWRDSPRAEWLTPEEYEEFRNEYEVARNCLQNLLIEANKTKE